jgi:hypothetical protein
MLLLETFRPRLLERPAASRGRKPITLPSCLVLACSVSRIVVLPFSSQIGKGLPLCLFR